MKLFLFTLFAAGSVYAATATVAPTGQNGTMSGTTTSGMSGGYGPSSTVNPETGTSGAGGTMPMPNGMTGVALPQQGVVLPATPQQVPQTGTVTPVTPTAPGSPVVAPNAPAMPTGR